MALNNEQKNIVNPYAETYVDNEESPTRKGVGYDYNNRRNKFILDCIHELYYSYYEFPRLGQKLFPGEDPSIEENPEGIDYLIVEGDNGSEYTSFTRDDFLAYAALYRQNAKVTENGELEYLTQEEELLQLEQLSNEENIASGYITDTARASWDPENRGPLYKLISIFPNHSPQYISDLRVASGKGDAPPVNTTPSLSDTFMPPELTGYISSNSNVDLDDWVNNADPGTATEKTYYNPKDKKFYCVVRTRHWDPYYYDIIHYAETDTNDWRLGTQPGPGLEVATNNVKKAMTLGITKILKATGKYDLAENNLRFLLESSPKKAYFMTHKDLRPASRWVYAVTVDREDLEQLGDQTTISYQEDSLTPLQKAKVVADPTKSPVARKQSFVADDLFDFVRSTRIVLEAVGDDMADEGIFSLPYATQNTRNVDPNAKSGKFFIAEEVARLSALPDVLNSFLAYNKKTLSEDSVIEFFLDSRYRLLYVCVDGELLTRGLGNINFLPPREEDSQDLQVVLNAFGMMTATSFSYLMSSRKIYEIHTQGGVTIASGVEWAQFLPEYTYPPLELDPELLQLVSRQGRDSLRRKKRLFERLSDIGRLTPQEAEKLYEMKYNNPDWIRMRGTELMQGLNCDTSQAFVLQEVFKFWNAFNAQNNIKAVIRETIALLRAGVATDNSLLMRTTVGRRVGTEWGSGMTATSPRELLDAANYYNESLDLDSARRPNKREDSFWKYAQRAGANPQNQYVIQRDFENWVNSQILCAVDVVGDVLQQGLLNPVGAPPEVNDVLRSVATDVRPRLKLNSAKMISTKAQASDYYKEIITAMITNAMKSLFAGVARDVIRAIAGCAPPEEQEDQLANFIRQYDYGLSMLSDHLEGVDVRNIAVQSGLVTPPENLQQVELTQQQQSLQERITAAENDIDEMYDQDQDPPQQSLEYLARLREELADIEEYIQNGVPEAAGAVPPSPEQMKAFLTDVSRVCTPAELQQLLFGDARSVLYEFLYETLTGIRVQFKIGEELNDDGETVDVMYNLDPSVYSSLSITKDIIRSFFENLGNALMPAGIRDVDDMSFQSPLEAYCNTRDPDLTNLNLNISVGQLQSQFAHSIDSRIDKINSLCQFLQDLNRIEEYINNLIVDIPILEWYNDILRLIAWLSNGIADWIAGMFDGLFKKPPPRVASSVDNFYSTNMGAELFFQIRDNLVALNTFQVATLSTYGPPTDNRYYTDPNFVQVDMNEEDSERSFYVMGGPQNIFRWSGEEGVEFDYLGIPYVDAASNTIKYLRPRSAHTAMWDREAIKGLAMPFNPTPIPETYAARISQYASRTGPWGYREALFSGFNTGDYPEIGNTSYGASVLEKISRTAWDAVPYTGFVSPIFMSSRSRTAYTNPGFEVYGIQVGTSRRQYEKLASWVPPGPETNVLDGGMEYNPNTRLPLLDDNAPLIYTRAYQGWENTPEGEMFAPGGNGGTRLPLRTHSNTQALMNNFFQGFINPAGTMPNIHYSPEPGENNIQPLQCLVNWKTSPDMQLQEVYYSEKGKRRLPGFLNAINLNPLKVLDDECVTKEEEKKAQALLRLVQARLQKMFINAMPISRIENYGWNNVATRALVSDYITRDIVNNLRDHKLLGTAYQLLEMVKKVYVDESENNIRQFRANNTQQENLKYFVDGVFVAMLNNISKYSEYEWINKNSYSYYSLEFLNRYGEDNHVVDRYNLTLKLFFQEMVNQLEAEDGMRFGLEGDQIEETRNYLQNNFLDPDILPNHILKDVGHYYFPLPSLTAAKIIYYDYSLDTAGRYSDTNYRIQIEMAAAYDGLLSAARGIATLEHSIPYRGFPQTIVTYTQDNEITYYNSREVSRRLEYINNLIDARELSENFDVIKYSVEGFLGLSRDEFDEVVLPWMRTYAEREGLWFMGTPGEYEVAVREGTNLVPYTSWYEGFNAASENWYNIMAGQVPTWGQSHQGEYLYRIFGDFMHRQAYATLDAFNRNDVWGQLGKAALYLNTNSEIIPGFFTSAEYYDNWVNFLSFLVSAKGSARAGDHEIPYSGLGQAYPLDYHMPDDPPAARELNRSKFLLKNEDKFLGGLVTLYESAAASAREYENIRTERNSLEKLIIE